MLRKFALKRNTQTPSAFEASIEDDANIAISSSHNSTASGMEESSKMFSSSEQHVGADDEEILPFTVDYLGFDHISEAQSVPLMKETLKKIKKSHTKSLRVDFVIHDGILKVSDVTQGALLITAPLYAVALCAQEQLRGFDSTFAINITRRRVHLCHVFQAGSKLEASSIVRSVALAFKSVGKLLKEKRERILLAESSLSSSERIRTESDGSRYRERSRTESEGSREKHRINEGAVSRKRAIPASSRSRSTIGPSSLATMQNEDSSDSGTKTEVVTALIHRESLTKRQQFADTSSKDGGSMRTNSIDTYTDRERDHSIERESREGFCTEERGAGVAPGKDKHFWEDDTRGGDVAKIDDLYAVLTSHIESGNHRQLEILLDSGLSINSKDINGLSLLHHAAIRNQVEITTLLLERGADPNCEGPNDQTPLHCAAGQGNRAIAKVLLEYGANVRAKDRLFRTPLHMCAGNLQSLEVSFLLVEHGARIEDNDLEGTRPVDLQLELQEMQNRLIQSACEAFTASDLSKSMSDSGSTSSRSNSMRSGKGLLPSQQGRRGLHKSNSFKRHSISLQSIPDDNSDEDETLKDGCNRDGQVQGLQHDGSNLSSISKSKKTEKQESFDSEAELAKDDSYQSYHHPIDLRKVNEKFLRKFEKRVNEEEFLEHFRSSRNVLDEPVTLQSDSECSVDSTKVETDSLCLEDEEFPPSMIQDFKYDDSSNRSEDRLLDTNLNVMDQKGDILDLRNEDLSRLRTSTKKEDSGSLDVMGSTETSLGDSNHDLSDDATISDSESIIKLRNNLNSKPQAVRSSFNSYTKLFKKDPASDALRLLVTLSFNPECHSSILASLCLPNTSGQIVTAAHSPRTSMHHLGQIASLLGNLFTVSGPDSKRKAVEAGLLKTVIDLLDTPEPVQGTCLSILNDLLQTESERDYSMAITNVPIEPLLNILEKESNIKKTVNEKLQVYQERTPLHGDPVLLASRKTAHHIHFQEKEQELVISKSLKREPKYLLEKRLSEKEMASQSLKLETNSHIHFMPPPDGIGRGRSDSFSSQSSRESSPSSMGKISSKSNSVSDVRLGESLAGAVLRQRRSSRGSGYSTDGSTVSSNIIASNQLCQPMVAKNIALRMMTAVSSNPKLQQELAKPRIIQILLNCSKDIDFEIALQSTMALSNIAMNINTHAQLETENVVEGLELNTKHSSTRVRYHAARGLIYLGHFNIEGIHVFSALEGEESLSNVIYSEVTTQQDQYYVRGTSLENLVLMLTKDIHLLWGGSTLPPPSPGDKKNGARGGISLPGKEGLRHTPTEQQILHFILTMYPTFVHPVVFMRLLLHRFHDPTYYKIFEEFEENGHVTGVVKDSPLPPVHARLMRVWVTWLESQPGDFRRCPTILEELGDLVEPMRAVGGPYVPCADRLEALMNKIKEDGSSRGSERSNHSENYHDALYEQCQKAIISGSIPSTEDYFIYLASLQLYIEDLEEYGQDFPQRINTISNITLPRLKQSIHPSLASSKNVLKRIKVQYEQILEESPTMRNAKHNYIDCCQGIEGFGCRFFKLKQRVPTKGGKNYNNVTRLLGISSKRVAILDEQTKACIEKWNFKDLKRWGTTEDNLYLKLTFKKRTVEFQMDSKSIFKELSNYILTCSMEMGRQGFANFDTSPWSSYAEQKGTWGVSALRLYLSELRTELDNSPTGKLESPLSCRERAITYAPTPGMRPPLQRSKSHGVAEVSKSAPGQCEPDTEITSSVFDWFRSRKPRTCSGKSELSTQGSSTTEHSTSQAASIETSSQRRPKLRRSSSSPKTHVEFTPVSVFEQHLSSPSHTSSSILSQSSNERAPMLDVSSDQENTKAVEKIQKDFCKAVARINYCRCPPDAQLPNLNRRDFSAFELLHHPKELARQITLIDHELFRAMSSRDIQKKISIGTLRKLKGDNSSQTVEKVAQRFNQLSNWVCVCIVSERNIDRRAQMFINFVETAKQCLELRNYNSVMAIVVAALGSAPVRRLKNTKEKIPPECLNQLNKMENLMDTKSNHKKYREALRTSPTPAVPYFGLYLKDLTFITDGNPDYLTNGLINLNKRRQICLLLDEIHRFQKKKYNFQKVPEVREYLFNRSYITEEQLHKMSIEIEPPIHAKYPATAASQANTGLDRLQSNLFRNTAPRVIGRRNLGIMKPPLNSVAV